MPSLVPLVLLNSILLVHGLQHCGSITCLRDASGFCLKHAIVPNMVMLAKQIGKVQQDNHCTVQMTISESGHTSLVDTATSRSYPGLQSQVRLSRSQ